MDKQAYKALSRRIRLAMRVGNGQPSRAYAIVDAVSGRKIRTVLGLKAARRTRDSMSAGRPEVSRSFGSDGRPLILNKA